MGKLDGKVALVTGGGHGIGKQIAVQLAQNGSNTVIVDYNEENGTATAEEITGDYRRSLFVKADVSSYTAMEQVHDCTIEAFGRIDILVLDAGIGVRNRLCDISVAEWNKTIAINLTGLFNTVKVFYDEFQSNQGSIVYISSGSALSGTGGGVSYPASKAGGEGLIRGLAKELGPRHVNVNAIAPRLIDTGEMMRVNYPSQDALDAVVQKIPVGRFGTVRDVANLAVFLADPENSYIQGQTILLDGGRTDGFFSPSYVEKAIENVENYGNYIVVNDGIALAHAGRKDGAFKDGLGLLVSDEGIEFDDGATVHLLFFFSQKSDTDCLTLFKEIIRLGNDHDAIMRICGLGSSDDVHRVLIEMLTDYATTDGSEILASQPITMTSD